MREPRLTFEASLEAVGPFGPMALIAENGFFKLVFDEKTPFFTVLRALFFLNRLSGVRQLVAPYVEQKGHLEYRGQVIAKIDEKAPSFKQLKPLSLLKTLFLGVKNRPSR